MWIPNPKIKGLSLTEENKLSVKQIYWLSGRFYIKFSHVTFTASNYFVLLLCWSLCLPLF